MSESTRITVLVENTTQDPALLAEHGLSYWIERDGRHVLFDAGQGGVLAGNAWKLKRRLEDVDVVVLSHGHYDHTGGLVDVLRGNRPVEVFLHPAALGTKFIRKADGSFREIGIPFPAKKTLGKSSVRVTLTETPTVVANGLTVTGPVPRVTDFEDTGGPFFLDDRGSQPDPLIDDQAMFFETRHGLIVLLGCAHAGVINTLRHVRELSGGKAIHAVLGGMHLVRTSSERLARTIAELRQFDIRILTPAHCTGMPATVALWSAFPGTCQTCHAGRTFTFDCPSHTS